ncbi:hypothetical protein [Mycobacterium paraterrae]|uniref:Uncharacterized protein n=1 Tax=Mycobacterium paraterrae TaxID=577492 RepID=A0ABY3VQE2_9MYCO|nr:hypothetical protein [Mycobacterium paraterrae]UMB70658.1 hypothetical protein MKK62_04940 [Mycobacterium paraterrae]
MTALASTLNQSHRAQRRLSSPAGTLREQAGDPGSYQFQIVAANVADVVRSIGGLIFDRAMAGWEVSVVIDGDIVIDDRPLRILGARLAERLSGSGMLRRPHLLAAATDVMVRSDAVRHQVLAMGDDEADVLLWGRHHPTNLGRTFVAVRHQPSAAARVFKSQALMAGETQAGTGADEGFYALT